MGQRPAEPSRTHQLTGPGAGGKAEFLGALSEVSEVFLPLWEMHQLLEVCRHLAHEINQALPSLAWNKTDLSEKGGRYP